MLAIFLNNKLISCDTILPVAMEVHARVRKPIRFYTVDYRTFDAIKANVVLWDAIHEIGQLILLGSRRRDRLSKIAHLPWAAREMGRLIAAAKRGEAAFLHFRGLNHPPLNVLQHANPQRTYFCESDSYGENELMRRIVEVHRPRERDGRGPVRGKLVAFQPEWHWLHQPETQSLPRFVFGPTRTRRIWLDYVRKSAERYHRDAFEAAGLPDSPETIAFMLGYLGQLDYLRDAETSRRLLTETLTVLAEEAQGRPIILKPHVITDMRIVGEEVARIRGLGAKVLVSYLHPSVLATRARFFISNYYSTTMADAFLMGVPTIEYTRYSDKALAVTSGGSMRPDYISRFIAGDAQQLRATIRELLARPGGQAPVGLIEDASGLIDELASCNAAGEDLR